MVGRIIVLLLLIFVLAAGGLIWFDYLNVIDAKALLAPVYKRIPFLAGESRTQPESTPTELLNLDAERLTMRLMTMDLRNLELDTRERELAIFRSQIEQMAQEVEEQKIALADLEKSLRAQAEDAENKDSIVDTIARNLTSMPPERAVGILAETEDQQVIDILRKTEEIAAAAGTRSIVPYWLSLMEPSRAAEIQRKMAGRPARL